MWTSRQGRTPPSPRRRRGQRSGFAPPTRTVLSIKGSAIPKYMWPRGVTASTLDPESSNRGSNPRRTWLSSCTTRSMRARGAAPCGVVSVLSQAPSTRTDPIQPRTPRRPHTTAQRRATANRQCTTDRADLRANRKQRWVNEGGRDAGRVKSSIPIWGKVMQYISSHYILLSMSMALPKQVSSLQGLHGVSQVTLAVNRPGIGSGWSQSKQNWTLRTVLEHSARMRCSNPW